MKKFLYIVYLGFLVGAARRFSKNLKTGIGMRLRDTYFPPMEYKVSLAYTKRLDIDTPDGHTQIAISVNSGIARTFVCKRAFGFFDVTLILKERMKKYISRHYGKLDTSFSLYSADYTARPDNWVFRLNINNLDSYDIRCINKAFEAMPREL